MTEARYADGRAATIRPAQVEIGAEALVVQVGEARHEWRYGDLRRADDGAGTIILKRKPDSGERLTLAPEAEPALRAAAPALFSRRAFNHEGWPTIASLAGAAWSLAAIFLVGVPLAAAPIADVMPPRYREQIAEISWSQVEAFTETCDDADEAERIVNDVAYRMMQASNVEQKDEIWISIVDAPIPNAFALPDSSIVVTDELIGLSEHPDELVGVIAHEIAHIERNHIMKNIIRQMGAGIFFDIVFGGAGAGQAIAIASVNLASLRYSRGDEADADVRGLDYLDAANIDTAGLARLFDRFAQQVNDQPEGVATLLSSHPATEARAQTARARSRAGLAPSMSAEDWAVVRRACGGAEGQGPDPAAAPAEPEATATQPEPAAPTPPLDGAPSPEAGVAPGKPKDPTPLP